MKETWKKLLSILHTDVVPATGCTEPVSLAFAAATAARELGEPVQGIEARVSANLMKNGMGVMVPGTGRHGLFIAAAAGALGGNPDAGLQVLEGIPEDLIAQAKEMVDTNRVTVGIAHEVESVLYSEATVLGANHTVKVCIADSHTNVVCIEKDGKTIFTATGGGEDTSEGKNAFFQSLSVAEIVEFAEQVPLAEVEFLRDSQILNDQLSKVGLTGEYGLGIGHALESKQVHGLIGKDLQNQVIIRTVAASDARMGGAKYPAMTNSGSGNQGIAATMPVVTVADYVKATDEERLRALVLANAMAVYIHGFLPKLSALCATITAAMGAASGMAWLMAKENKVEAISYAISSMIGDAVGMVCDGAANSCSMKVATACTSAFRSVLLALDKIRVSGNDGIVSFDVDESIRNVGMLACNGMTQTDTEVLNVMLHKNKTCC